MSEIQMADLNTIRVKIYAAIYFNYVVVLKVLYSRPCYILYSIFSHGD